MTDRYSGVNGTWPAELPPLTGQEAIAAAKRLWRFALKRPLRVTRWQVTSGNRRNRILAGKVNPDRGWHDLVHHISHRVHYRLHPGAKPHDGMGRHAFIERELIQHVVESGWLTGKLRRPAKPKPVVDARAVRYGRVLARITAWEGKAKRAENALKKLRRQRAYYEKRAP